MSDTEMPIYVKAQAVEMAAHIDASDYRLPMDVSVRALEADRRAGKIATFKYGRSWYTTDSELRKYVAGLAEMVGA